MLCIIEANTPKAPSSFELASTVSRFSRKDEFCKTGQGMILRVLRRARPNMWITGLLSIPRLLAEKLWANDQPHLQLPKCRSPTSTWTILDSYPEFTVFQHHRTIKILLTQAGSGNLLTLAMVSRLTSLFKEISADRRIFRIVITGEGKYFCAGMDLREKRPEHSTEHFSALYNLFEAIDACPQTTIAAINGPAFGGGVGLAFVFDIRIAVLNATMCLSEVKLGLCPATISRFVVREWGFGLARMAMLSGRKTYPEELYRMGAIHTIVPDQESLPTAVDNWLYDLKFTEPRASALCKRLVRDCWRSPGGDVQFQTAQEVFEAMMNENSQSHRGIEDFRKGIRGTDWETVLTHNVNDKYDTVLDK